VFECIRLTAEDGIDRGAECFELAERWGFDQVEIARRLAAALAEYAKRIEVEVEPEVEEPAKVHNEARQALVPQPKLLSAVEVLEALNDRHAIIDNVGNPAQDPGHRPAH
jgi:hypothetical protein